MIYQSQKRGVSRDHNIVPNRAFKLKTSSILSSLGSKFFVPKTEDVVYFAFFELIQAKISRKSVPLSVLQKYHCNFL